MNTGSKFEESMADDHKIEKIMAEIISENNSKLNSTHGRKRKSKSTSKRNRKKIKVYSESDFEENDS